MMTQPKRGTVFSEVTGKAIKSIKYEENPDWQALEVAFTDGTLLSIEFSARVTVQASYLEVRRGDLKMIQNFGRVSGDIGTET